MPIIIKDANTGKLYKVDEIQETTAEAVKAEANELLANARQLLWVLEPTPAPAPAEVPAEIVSVPEVVDTLPEPTPAPEVVAPVVAPATTPQPVPIVLQ